MTKKILLADDSVTIQKVVELTFSEGDFQVTSVSNGKLAIEQLTKNRPDIVIADIIMPEMSGYDVAEYIKKNPEFSAIPVILLTGTFEPFDEARAKNTGAETYVTKPFDSKMLVEKVESLLAQKVKVEGLDKVAPATIFQSRQEYEIPGVVSEEYIEKLKENQPQEFPSVEELKDNESVSSSIAADFISSTDEIEALPTEETPAEKTAISADNLPPSDFEGFEALSEPPLPSWDKLGTEELGSVEEPPLVEEPFVSQEQEKVIEQETPSDIIQSEIKEEVPKEKEDWGFNEQPPELGEEVVEISTPAPQETIEEEKVVDSSISQIGIEEKETPSLQQENVIEVGEEVPTPSFFESIQTLEPETPPEIPEIVTDLSEQVIMVAEGQKIMAEEKPKDDVLEEPSSKIEEELSKEEEAFTEPPITKIQEPYEVREEEALEKPLMEEEALIESPEQKIEEPSEVREEEALEKPLMEEEIVRKQEVTETTVSKVDVSPEVIESVVKKVVEEIAPAIIKNIAWEVIPELANTIIKKRIEELEKEAEK